ncbi:MAG TPA: hypothetical protein VGS28_03380 [Candidatus Saccharimonadales bacterium]|nr:hypothetical protein [Candidatus Saccharimonadales bacterium]
MQNFLVGAAVGAAVEPLTVEPLAHQVLAHRNAILDPRYERLVRRILNVTGMSPNRFAAYHRYHHALGNEPALSLRQAVAHIFEESSGNSVSLDDPDVRASLLFDGTTHDDDALIQVVDGAPRYRNDPRLERFVARGGMRRMLPLLGTAAAIGLGNRLAGRDHPWWSAAGSVAGFVTGLSAHGITTAYTEGRAGTQDGRIGVENLDPLQAFRMRSHQAHHSRPEVLTAGYGPVRQLAAQALIRSRLMRLHQPAPATSQEAA